MHWAELVGAFIIILVALALVYQIGFYAGADWYKLQLANELEQLNDSLMALEEVMGGDYGLDLPF